MFSLSSANRFFLYQHNTDMRKGFDSLCGLVRSELKANPADGSVYVFFNKGRNLIKLLRWETDGFTLYYKRLEKGTFEPLTQRQTTEISWQELMLIVSGIKLASVRKNIRYKVEK